MDQPFVNSILHPTDFTVTSENAFAHALALSLSRKTKLTILHVGNSKNSWNQFPAVRKTLEKWGHLKSDSSRSAVFDELNVRVEKISLKGKNPLKTVVNFLKNHRRDLIVLSTSRDDGVPGWIRPTDPEKIANKSKTMTLFIPGAEEGFVNLNTGEICLKRILIPIDHNPSPYPAIEYALRTTNLVQHSTEITLLYVGPASKMPSLNLPERENVKWSQIHQEGEVVTEIMNTALQKAADLIVMATAGQNGFLDALRGSITEQVLRKVPCPVLAVPVNE
jgi:hypothetical protein